MEINRQCLSLIDQNNKNSIKRKLQIANKIEAQDVKKAKLSDDGRLYLSNFISETSLQEIQQENENVIEEIQDIRKVQVTAIPTKSTNKNATKKKLNRIPESITNRNIRPLIIEGNFYGLSKAHKKFLLNLRGVTKLYSWQEQCLSLQAIHNRTNLIYSAPTSGGKTLVSEILMLREILLRKQNVIFILPFVSIVQEKVHEMMPLAVEYNFLIEEYCAGKGSIPPVKRPKKNSIFICTIEKGQILLDSLLEAGRIAEISLIVVDELHMLGDSHRGHILESLLTKIIYLEQIPIQIVGMSATISNIDEISSFLVAETFTYDFRPVELKEYVKSGTDLFKIDNSSKELKKTDKIVGKSYTTQMLRRDPDHISYFVHKPAIESSCLVFCPTKVNCENVALLISESLPNNSTKKSRDEKKSLMAAIRADLNGSLCPTLAKTIPFGVAYHHSGLTTDERRHIENAFNLGTLTVICCTSTLAAGVNLPASRVIIRAPYVGQDLMSLSQYRQMIGRAGRAGKSEKGDSILICDRKDFDKVKRLLTSNMDETISSFVGNLSHIRSLMLNLIGTKLCKNFYELHDYSKCMLARVQENRFGKSLKAIFIETLKQLLDDGFVLQTFQCSRSSQPAIFSYKLSDVTKDVYAVDPLDVNRLGRAAVSSGMLLEDAQNIDDDLKKAHEGLVLSQCLHLLFVIAPKEMVESIFLNYMTYSDILLKLDASQLNTAGRIGIDEKTAMKMVRNPNFDAKFVKVLKRFYTALILHELWNGREIFDVSKKYKVSRGIVHKLMYAASSQAYSVFKFCEIFDDFWVFKEILEQFSKRLTYCCSTQLLPLMELPCVKIARAKMMFSAGLCTVSDVAALTADDLVKTIKNINKKQAEQVIRAAKNTLAEQIDTLEAQMYEMKKAVKEVEK